MDASPNRGLHVIITDNPISKMSFAILSGCKYIEKKVELIRDCQCVYTIKTTYFKYLYHTQMLHTKW